MTIRLTEDEFLCQFQEANEEQLRLDPSDKLDITYKFDARVARGYVRVVELREGIALHIHDTQYCETLLVDNPEQEVDFIRCSFCLVGNEHKFLSYKPEETIVPLIAGKRYTRSNGLLPQGIDNHDANYYSLLVIRISPQVLRSFSAFSEGELPDNLQHLVRPSSQEAYLRPGETTPIMAAVLQQILHCPYQGLVKRAYLESKVIELMALVLDHEAIIQQGEAVKQGSLKPEQLERVHYAKEILLRDLCHPPSLGELAQQVGLNDFLLKQGFRQAFGTTVFRELRSHRLEQAKQLLAEQDITVAVVAQRVGYADTTAFARAFKHKFGVNPKEYQKACR